MNSDRVFIVYIIFLTVLASIAFGVFIYSLCGAYEMPDVNNTSPDYTIDYDYESIVPVPDPPDIYRRYEDGEQSNCMRVGDIERCY